MHCYRDGGPHIPIAWSRSFKISTTRLQGATVMTKPIDDPIVSGRRLGGKARFLALLRYGAWLEVAIDELATAIIMRRLARSRPEHDAMTEGRETFPTARFLDLLRFSRATDAGLMKGRRK